MDDVVDLQVHIARDSETGRWFISESDIPGLWLEATSPGELLQKIAAAAPEMIELNAGEIRMARGGPATPHQLRATVRPVFHSSLDLAVA